MGLPPMPPYVFYVIAVARCAIRLQPIAVHAPQVEPVSHIWFQLVLYAWQLVHLIMLPIQQHIYVSLAAMLLVSPAISLTLQSVSIVIAPSIGSATTVLTLALTDTSSMEQTVANATCLAPLALAVQLHVLCVPRDTS